MNILFLMLALAGGGAGAQALQDPTRPPVALLHPIAGAAGPADLHLQSILIGRAAGGRRVAIIDGETVRVGDRVAGARVIAIHAAEVHVQRGARREILTLQAPDTAPTPASNAGKPE